MGKHTKLKHPKSSPAAAVTVSAPMPVSIDAMLTSWIARLETLFGSVEATLKTGTATPALLRETAAIARAIVTVSAELRAREKAEHDRGDEVSRAVVMQWFRTLGDVERRSFLRELQVAEPKRSGLA